MRIGELAKACNIPISTIRFYEKKKLIHSHRSHNGYRFYNKEIIPFLNMIIRAKALGFSLKEIQEISHLFSELGEDQGNIRNKLENKLVEIEDKIKEMRKLKNEINKLLKASCPL
jgi:DNA-binding transcriptional MerR regulator